MIDYLFRALEPSREALRELQAASDIAHAFLTAERSADVYDLAVQRVTPLIGADFGCVFLQDPRNGLLKAVAAHNWPDTHAEHLSTMTVRIGLGPTGRAVAENRIVEVRDIFADPTLEDWWEAARELGFTSSASLPLGSAGTPMGAMTLYFRNPRTLSEADRGLLGLVANQLAAVAEKAHLIETLREANTRLREQNLQLETRYHEAEEARAAKGEFLANVSHELRTPLTAVLGYTYLLREGLSGSLGEDQLQAVHKIESAATTLMWLINDLLDLTHLRLGRTPIEVETCDALSLTRAAMTTVEVPENIVLASELTEAAVPVYSDPAHVLRILKSLLSNAIKFTPGGCVTVRLVAAGSEQRPTARWEVEDTGIGIAEEDHKRIFDEFQQVDGSATRRFGGTGLGLALSRELAHRLGGTITVRSQLGAGATFALELPATEAAFAGAREPSVSDSPAHPTFR